MTPLSAFWHRTRKQYVPLTTSEWERKASVTGGLRRSIHRAGHVISTQASGRDDYEIIYEITPAGIEAHRASIMRAAT